MRCLPGLLALLAALEEVGFENVIPSFAGFRLAAVGVEHLQLINRRAISQYWASTEMGAVVAQAGEGSAESKVAPPGGLASNHGQPLKTIPKLVIRTPNCWYRVSYRLPALRGLLNPVPKEADAEKPAAVSIEQMREEFRAFAKLKGADALKKQALRIDEKVDRRDASEPTIRSAHLVTPRRFPKTATEAASETVRVAWRFVKTRGIKMRRAGVASDGQLLAGCNDVSGLFITGCFEGSSANPVDYDQRGETTAGSSIFVAYEELFAQANAEPQSANRIDVPDLCRRVFPAIRLVAGTSHQYSTTAALLETESDNMGLAVACDGNEYRYGIGEEWACIPLFLLNKIAITLHTLREPNVAVYAARPKVGGSMLVFKGGRALMVVMQGTPAHCRRRRAAWHAAFRERYRQALKVVLSELSKTPLT